MTEKNPQPRGGDRRSADAVLNALDRFQSGLDRRHEENVKSIDASAAEIREVKEQLKRVLAGFPEGDPEGHCRYHVEVMDELEERKKLWREIRAHILKGGAWAMLVGVLWGAWRLFLFFIERKL